MAPRYWWHDMRVWVIVLGLLCTARGVWDITRAFQFASGVDTTARVVGMERVGEGRGRSSRYARVVFADQTGGLNDEETETRVDPDKVRVGATVRVRYLPSNPQRVRIAEGADSPGVIAWICLVLGVGLIGTGTALLIRARRPARQ